MFENLTDRLQNILQGFNADTKLSKENIEKALIELRKALIEADVSLKVIKVFLDRIRRSAIGQNIVTGVSATNKFIEIVQTELVRILGQQKDLILEEKNNKPSVIMLLGLQGAGKTTTAAKLALTLKKQNKKVLLVALDLQRPAAIEQLSILANQIETDIIKDLENKNILDIAEKAMTKARDEKYNYVIFDTAGRLQVDNELMAELLLLEKKFKPIEQLLVIDSLIGQEAINVAEAFKTQIGLTGAILTKMDGDTRGGVALSLVEGVDLKIKFISNGEKIEPLEEFDPERLSERILGFGDIVALVRKAEEAFSEQEMKNLEKKLMSGKIDFETFLQINRFIGKLGGIGNIFGMMGSNFMSGFGKNKEEKDKLLSKGEEKFKHYQYAIQSMTQEERKNPLLIQKSKSRIRRISLGSGISEESVKNLINEFLSIQKAMSLLSSMGGMNNLKSGILPNPETLAQSLRAQKKEEKSIKKNSSNNPFGGGSFLKF